MSWGGRDSLERAVGEISQLWKLQDTAQDLLNPFQLSNSKSAHSVPFCRDMFSNSQYTLKSCSLSLCAEKAEDLDGH